MKNEQPSKQPDALARRDLVGVASANYDRSPDHVREPELGRGQADDLSKDVQPADYPSDDSALFTGHELR